MVGYRKDQKAAEAARKARNQYARKWRARNRDKVRIYNQNYWIKKAANDGETAAAEGR